MPRKKELETKHLTELAVLCGKITESPSSDPATIQKAHALRLEWVRLQYGSNPEQMKQQEGGAEEESLKKRMVEFLASRLY